MSVAVINHNPDLKRLQDEGYELEVREGCAIVTNVPYLDCTKTVKYGILVSPLEMSGDLVKYRKMACKHVIYFQGTMPYRSTGEPLNAIMLGQTKGVYAGVKTDMSFSNKPSGDYNDYYEKFVKYIQILSSEAQAIQPEVTAATFKKVISDEVDAVFNYADTNASRGSIMDVTDKLKKHKIGIVGLGGTGSYILDQLAKTPVAEIHLYDGDVFCQHNAFRAPGAADKDIFVEQPFKTDYYKSIYENMHKKIFSHHSFLDEDNVRELEGLDFVFLAMDSGRAKKLIVNFLKEYCIDFIDTGIDINRAGDSLIGMTRSTLSVNGNTKTAEQHISYEEPDKDLYQSNVQTADMNAFCALNAVILWKKKLGFYKDNINKENCVYTTNDGECTWS